MPHMLQLIGSGDGDCAMSKGWMSASGEKLWKMKVHHHLCAWLRAILC